MNLGQRPKAEKPMQQVDFPNQAPPAVASAEPIIRAEKIESPARTASR